VAVVPVAGASTAHHGRVRFDDMTEGGVSFELVDPLGELVARDLCEVSEVLAEAEDAAASGRWVAGWVTYEAAAGLTPGASVCPWPAGHPLADLPLVWFGVFGRRRRVPRVSVGGGDGTHGRPMPGSWRLEQNREWHRQAVARIQSLIADGELYQVNLTTRLTADVEDMAGLYRSMAQAQGGAFSAYIESPTHTVACASPELFFERRGSRITTRPMKGTAARGRWPAEDDAAGPALAASPKDRAENVMIVDLLRNDLGRVAVPGSVRVPALWTAERFPSMWQLTSTVEADVDDRVGLVDMFRALFPSGSVTGAPKIRTMRAIAAIEAHPRGVYCGAVGWLAPPGCAPAGCASGVAPRPSASFAVAIRTATAPAGGDVSPHGTYVEYGVGGGITAPSDARAEWAELLTKAGPVAGNVSVPVALLETFRIEPALGAVNLDRHISRLAASARYFGFTFDAANAVEAIEAVGRSAGGALRARLILHPGGRTELTTGPLDGSQAIGIVRLALAETPIDSRDVLLFHKHLDRSRYDGFRVRSPAADDVILWNEDRQVTETCIASLAVELDGVWWTPPVRCGLLPGVGRQVFIDRGRLHERVIGIDDLARATGLATLSSLRGWRPATLC
jgi:para-aminobenzoate synthetase/4-amino-4-deoxychorismate lyase